MRRAVFIVLALYIALFAWSFISVSGGGLDAAGRGMAMGFLMIGAGLTALFAVPALVLAVRNRAPQTALILALFPGAVYGLIMAGNLF